MKILVTGGTGRLGKSLCPKLIQNYSHIYLLIRNTTDLTTLHPWLENITFINHDLNELESYINNSADNFDICLHMATAYINKIAGNSEIYSTNYHLPKQLAEILSGKNLKCFLNIDTSLPDNINQYAESKAQFRNFLKNQQKIPKIINLYLQQFFGIPDDNDGIIPSILNAILNGEPKFNLTPGLQKRDFIHIDDACNAIIATIENLDKFPAGYSEYQIGSGTAVNIRTLVDLVTSQFESCNTEFSFGALPYRENEAMEMVADYSAFQQITDWIPRISIAEGIHSLVTSANKTMTDQQDQDEFTHRA